MGLIITPLACTSTSPSSPVNRSVSSAPRAPSSPALVNLIPRFYDVIEGKITIDGIDVRDVPLHDLRKVVGIALQEAVLFQDELRPNLKFGAPDVEDDAMFDTARRPMRSVRLQAPGPVEGTSRSPRLQLLGWSAAAIGDREGTHAATTGVDPRRQHERTRCIDRGPGPSGDPDVHGRRHDHLRRPADQRADRPRPHLAARVLRDHGEHQDTGRRGDRDPDKLRFYRGRGSQPDVHQSAGTDGTGGRDLRRGAGADERIVSRRRDVAGRKSRPSPGHGSSTSWHRSS